MKQEFKDGVHYHIHIYPQTDNAKKKFSLSGFVGNYLKPIFWLIKTFWPFMLVVGGSVWALLAH